MFDVPDQTEELTTVAVSEENNDTMEVVETVVEIEGTKDKVSNKKLTEAELLKTSIFNDLGLYFTDMHKPKKKTYQPRKDLHVDYDDRERRNTIWVSPVWSERKYEPIKKEDRNPFILKVFLIVFINLSICVCWSILVLKVNFLFDFFKTMYGLYFAFIGAFLILGASILMIFPCTMVCPWSGIALVAMNVGMGLIVGFVVAKASVVELLIAFIATGTVVLVCIALACTDFDFTKYYIYLVAIGAVLVTFSIALALMYICFKIQFSILNLGLSFLWAIFHSVSLIMVLQMVIGGYSMEVSPDLPIPPAIEITISIFALFLEVLNIVMYFSRVDK